MSLSMEDIRVYPDMEALSKGAAVLFLDAAQQSIGAKDTFEVALSGGSTPKPLYELLGSDEYRDRADWAKVHLFWTDERCVPPEHEDSNFRLAYDTLISKVPLPKKNVHRIRGEYGPEHGAREYEAELRNHFGTGGLPAFDLVLLGIGEDGHTASLFCASEVLKERDRLVVAVRANRIRHERISLTLSVLNHADRVLFLVAGSSKAHMLAEVVGRGNKRALYPAGLVRPLHRRPTWLVDGEAAAQLHHTPGETQ